MVSINNLSSSDTMDVLSPLRAPIKPQENKSDLPRSDQADLVKTDVNKQLKTEDPLKKEEEKKEKAPSSMEEVKEMVSELNDYMDDLQTSLGFSVSKDPDNQVVFQIKNRETNEVIKQIPAEEIQDIKKRMTELTGMLLDQHA